MARIKDGYCRLEHRYLFQEVARRVEAFRASSPQTDIIRMGIGDVSLPLAPALISAMHGAVEDLSAGGSFHGYGPEHGYEWLREAIVAGDYAARGIAVDTDEVFINDGAKSDLGNILDLFSKDNTVGITDPVYPVYVDTNVIDGRKISFIPCSAADGFSGEIPQKSLDIVYLCFPNNPTGAVANAAKLRQWVDYARRNGTLILFDSAYEAFIREEGIPHSIYEIEGARECAIEFRSFSKTAGFTGVRCGYTVIPKELRGWSGNEERSLNALWERRQGCKFNGASYVSQRGACAVYSPEGRQQTSETVDYYLQNAAIIRDAMDRCGLYASGGTNAPYIWARTPGGMDDWEFFDALLKKTGVVVTPGSGFGPAGRGYFRLTSFTERSRTIEAMERIEKNINEL